MDTITTIKVSHRYQVSIPSAARRRLNIQVGDRLLVDIQDGMLILIPAPTDFVVHMAGLHHELWQGVDTTEYLSDACSGRPAD